VKPPKIKTTWGTARDTGLNPILRGDTLIRTTKRPRAEFSYTNDRVSIEGACATVQDLRDALRELLRMLEDD